MVPPYIYGLAGPSTANFVAINHQWSIAGPSMAAMDGPAPCLVSLSQTAFSRFCFVGVGKRSGDMVSTSLCSDIMMFQF